MKKAYPTTKQILKIAGIGAFIVGSLLLPGLPKILKGTRIDFENFLFEDEWEPFDESRLRQKLKILQKQKVIKLHQVEDKFFVQITKKGRRRLLKYSLDDLRIEKPKQWDKRWRIVAYDIPDQKKGASNALQHTLKQLGFLRLQKSVYLYPYPCSEIIEFLRAVYGVGEHVTYLTLGFLEDEEAYKEYFGL